MASAQQPDIQVTDNDAMRASASKHTALVDKTVTLNAEQRPQVNEAYMELERKLDGMNQRFDRAKMTKEEREAEMRPQWVTLDQMVDHRLSQILTPEQHAKWAEANK